jgi:hypothetical protein
MQFSVMQDVFVCAEFADDQSIRLTFKALQSDIDVPQTQKSCVQHHSVSLINR